MSTIPDDGSVNYKVNSFLKKLFEMYNSCCPIRSKTISYKRFMRPWIDNQLISAINHTEKTIFPFPFTVNGI